MGLDPADDDVDALGLLRTSGLEHGVGLFPRQARRRRKIFKRPREVRASSAATRRRRASGSGRSSPILGPAARLLRGRRFGKPRGHGWGAPPAGAEPARARITASSPGHAGEGPSRLCARGSSRFPRRRASRPDGPRPRGRAVPLPAAAAGRSGPEPRAPPGRPPQAPGGHRHAVSPLGGRDEVAPGVPDDGRGERQYAPGGVEHPREAEVGGDALLELLQAGRRRSSSCARHARSAVTLSPLCEPSRGRDAGRTAVSPRKAITSCLSSIARCR